MDTFASDQIYISTTESIFFLDIYLQFSAILSVKDKVNIRQSLRQRNEESIEEFLDRCTCAQHAITDDSVGPLDASFERDVLLNFLLGMKPELQSYVIISNQRNLQGFFMVALEAEQNLTDTVIKYENDEVIAPLGNNVFKSFSF